MPYGLQVFDRFAVDTVSHPFHIHYGCTIRDFQKLLLVRQSAPGSENLSARPQAKPKVAFQQPIERLGKIMSFKSGA
jgi:hypothetical protein